MQIAEKTANDFINMEHRIKTFELIIIAIIDIAFFLILILNRPLRTAIFGNKYLFMICSLMWLSLLIAFVFILIDFIQLKNVASKTFELSQVAYSDVLTGLPNRHSIDLMIKIQKSDFETANIGCVLVTIANLNEINTALGHSAGDRIIRDFCQLLISVSSNYGFMGRNGGNDFLGIFENCDEKVASDFFNDLEEQVRMYNIGRDDYPIKLRYSSVFNCIEHKDNIGDLLTIVYRRIKESPAT